MATTVKKKSSVLDSHSMPGRIKRNKAVNQVARKIKMLDTNNWIYVSPQEKFWSVRKDGTTKAIRIFNKKQPALQAARKVVNRGKIIVYNSVGEISKIIP
jgi:Uncharacterized protein conserved in bacteria (DUF2188)